MVTEIFSQVYKLFEKQKPITTTVGSHTYAIKQDGTLGDVVRPPASLTAPVLSLLTLTGFVATYKAKIDKFPKDKVAVQVESFDSVALVSLEADEFGRRHVWMRAKNTPVTPFRFGEYYEPEPFLIGLQAGFMPSDNVTALQVMCSQLSAGSAISTSDDGFSQTVTVTEGAVTRGNVAIPSRLPLAPYRTFREIVPEFSDFMLRIKGAKDKLPTLTLLEVDGGKWKVDTVAAIGRYLQAELPDAVVIA